MDLRLDDLRHPAVIALLQEHLDWMHRTSPPESVHALDLDALRQPDIAFWTLWDGETLAGCGALRALDATHGEVKSMRTAQTHLRRGVAATMLDHLVAEARRRGMRASVWKPVRWRISHPRMPCMRVPVSVHVRPSAITSKTRTASS